MYLAHVGSFVPAESAIIGPIDAIYALTSSIDTEHPQSSNFITAVNLASTALRNANDKSLILMDEFLSPINKVVL